MITETLVAVMAVWCAVWLATVAALGVVDRRRRRRVWQDVRRFRD